MIAIAIALFASIVSVAFLTLLFLLVIYLKEYRREEKILEQYSNAKIPMQDLLPVYLVEKPAKKKKTLETSVPKSIDKDKKCMN